MLCLVPVWHIMHFHVYNISPNWVGTFYLLFFPLLFGEREMGQGDKGFAQLQGDGARSVQCHTNHEYITWEFQMTHFTDNYFQLLFIF